MNNFFWPPQARLDLIWIRSDPLFRIPSTWLPSVLNPVHPIGRAQTAHILYVKAPQAATFLFTGFSLPVTTIQWQRAPPPKTKSPPRRRVVTRAKGSPKKRRTREGRCVKYPYGIACFYFVVPIGRGFQGKGGLKAATAVDVRHILCEKHSKAMEALQRIQVRHA